MALDPDSHHVPGLPLVPVGGRPDRDHALDRLVVVEPDLDADALPARNGDQVVVHREALRLRLRRARQALRAGRVQVAARGVADVAGDPARAPAEVVRRRDVGEHREALLVAQVPAGLDQPRRVDDQRRLRRRPPASRRARGLLVGQVATSRISYAGGHACLDLLLQPDDPLDERLRPRRAAGDVDVHRDDLVHALEDRVVVEHPA